MSLGYLAGRWAVYYSLDLSIKGLVLPWAKSAPVLVLIGPTGAYYILLYIYSLLLVTRIVIC